MFSTLSLIGKWKAVVVPSSAVSQGKCRDCWDSVPAMAWWLAPQLTDKVLS